MANSIAVSSRWTLPASWAWRTASRTAAVRSSRRSSCHQARRRASSAERQQLALAADGGDRHRLVGELDPAGRVGIGDEDRRQHAAHPHLVATEVGRQLGDRPLEQLRRARRRPAMPMSKPTPDSDIIQLSAAPASSIGSPSRRAHTAASRAAAIALARSPWQRSRSDRSSASSARSRAPTWSVTSALDAIGPRRRRPRRRRPRPSDGRRAGRRRCGCRGRRASRPRTGGGRARPAPTGGRSTARWRAATRRCRSRRRVRPRRARIAWPIRAWGTLSRPAPSSTSSPAATAASVASSRSSPSSPLASTSTGSVAALPATAARLSTWTTRGSRRSRRRPIIARIDSGSSSPTSPVGVADQLGQEERVAAGGGVQLGGLAPRRGR